MTTPLGRYQGPCVLLLLVSLLGCAVAPTHKMRSGALEPTTGQRVLFVPVKCTSVNDACDEDYARGAAGIVQKELEFAGYSIVDAEKLVMQARTREDASAELRLFGERIANANTLEQRGSIFEDLPPSEKRWLMQEANAQGILNVRIDIAPHDSYVLDYVVEVAVRYGVGEDGAELGWVSRCRFENEALGQRFSTAKKVQMVSECAVNKALGS